MPTTILRKCTSCGEEKKSGDFYYSQTRKEYMKRCSACSVAYSNEYQKRKWSSGDYKFILRARGGCIRRDLKRRKDGAISCSKDLSRILVALWEKQDGKCAYTGAPMGLGGGSYHQSENRDTHCTVDRVDSSIGYEAGNLVLCCASMNRMKQEGDLEDFFNRCGDIYNRMDDIRERVKAFTK